MVASPEDLYIPQCGKLGWFGCAASNRPRPVMIGVYGFDDNMYSFTPAPLR